MWTLWKQRNRRAFNDIERSNQSIKYIFIYIFVNWVRMYIEDHIVSMIDFRENHATKHHQKKNEFFRTWFLVF